MDRIELRGLRAVGTHGALPEEQFRAQPFEVDLDLQVNLRPAGQSDDLAAYTVICQSNFVAARLNGTENRPKRLGIRRMSD